MRIVNKYIDVNFRSSSAQVIMIRS